MTFYVDISADRAVLVSDFDGTLGQPDFYDVVRERAVAAGAPDYWLAYEAGRMTHFDALKAHYEAVAGGTEALLDLIRAIRLPDDLPAHLDRLRSAGWEVIVVSAGCRWYIDLLLERAGARLPVIANPGHVEDGHLVMQRPVDSPFHDFEMGVDKVAVIKWLQEKGHTVAFAGDGSTDLEPSRRVPEQWRFARGELAAACRERGYGFRSFQSWVDVADALSEQPPSAR